MNDRLNDLPTEAWDSLQQLLARFEGAWQGGKRPRLEDYLPQAGDLRSAALAELVHIELECRLKAGEPARVEEYLRRYPELAGDAAAVVELIEAEWELRRRRGESSPQEYLDRFPPYVEPLRTRLQAAPVRRAVAVAPADAAASPPVDSVAAFVGTLRGSQILKAAQEEELAGTLAPSFTEPKALARELLQRGWLTAFQANQLFRGKGRELLLGQYLLLERLGEGGMGAVFKARHQRLNRVVAVKLIRKDRLADPSTIQRFQREAQAAARLHHPNIVTVYDADEVRGTLFFSMEYVEGTDLAKLVKQRGPLPVAHACDYARQAALGLQHAHEQGMVHRDIKPSNLLLTAKGEIVKVLDMGLARLDEPDEPDRTDGLTATGAVMGTPDYIAPEQAIDAHAADVRADIYSLGCSLYYLLTGQPPFPGGSLAQKLLWHQQAEPKPVEQLRPDLPAGLAAVLRRMMAKKPADRFQTPGEVAAALEAVCRVAIPLGPPPLARVVAAAGASGPQATYPMAIPVAAVPVAVPTDETVAVSGADSTPSGVPDSTAARPALLAGRRRWLAAGGLALPLLAGLVLVFALRKADVPSPPPDSTAASASPLDRLKGEDIPAAERFAWQPKELVAILGEHRAHHPEIHALALSPDGTLVATGGINDKIVRLSDAETMHQRVELPGHEDGILSLAFSPDGLLLASGSGDKTIRLWDLGRMQTVRTLTAKDMGMVWSLAFSPDGRQLLSAGEDKLVRLWDVETGQEVRPFKGHTTPVGYVAFSPDGKRAVSGGMGSDPSTAVETWALRLWDVATGKELLQFKGHTGALWSVAYSPDGSRVLSASRDNTLRWWDAATGMEVRRENVGGVTHVAFSPDGKYVLSCDPYWIALWDAAGGQRPLGRLQVQGAKAATFLPDKRRILVSVGNTLRQWDTATGKELHTPVGHGAAVCDVAFSRDDRYLFSVSADHSVRRWDLASGKSDWQGPAPPNLDGSYNGHLALSPDGRYVLVGGGSAAYLLDAASGKKLRDDLTFSQQCSGVAFLDARQALLADTAGPVGLWDVERGKELESYRIEGVTYLRVVPVAEGKKFLCRDSSGNVWLYDRSGKKVDRQLPVKALRFALDATERFLYFGGPDGTVGMYDLKAAEAKPVTYFDLHQGGVVALALSPDGRTLATADVDGHCILWDTAFLHGQGDRQKLDEWQQPGGIRDLTFAHHSRHLAVANGNSTVYILRLNRVPGS